MNQFWIRVLLVFMSLATLTACTRNQMFLLESNPCNAPCWYNVIPGKTKKSELVGLLQSIPKVDFDSIEKRSVIKADDSYYWNFKGTIEDWGRAIFNDDTISSIEFSLSKDSVPLENVIQIFGSPENILAIEQKAEHRYVYAYLNYPKKGISILITPPYTESYTHITITPDLYVESIWFYDPLLFNRLFSMGPIDVNNSDTINKKYQNWVGYGQYSFYEK